MDCTHNTTDGEGGFSLFVKAKVLPREEINKQAKVYRNFLNEDGTPKSRNRHPLKGIYTLAYHHDRITDKQIKEKFQQIRQHIKATDPTLTEEYTKRRLVYWNGSNQSLYTLEPRRNSVWLGFKGEKDLKGYRKYLERNRTFFRITNKTKVDDILPLYSSSQE